MLQAYVGLISRQGLEVLCPEHPETLQFLQRRAARAHGTTVCFWSVTPEEAVQVVLRALHAGDRSQALRLLRQAARDGGPLFPAADETTESGCRDAHR